MLIPSKHEKAILSQRFILGIGLAILLIITGTSIGLDAKSRRDAASVDHSMTVLQEISALQLLIRRAESAARGFVLSGDPVFEREFREAGDGIAPAYAGLLADARADPDQTRILAETKPIVERRIAVSADLIRLKAAGDAAGIAAVIEKAEGRSTTRAMGAGFEKALPAPEIGRGTLGTRSPSPPDRPPACTGCR